MQFKAIFYVLAVLVANALANVNDVVNAIKAINNQAHRLDAAIEKLANTDGSLDEALAVHNVAVRLRSDINKGTSDARAIRGTVSENDGRTIVTALQVLEPSIVKTLADLIAKKAAFADIVPAPVVVLSDLRSLSSSASEFETALLTFLPAGQTAGKATSIKNNINNAFRHAIVEWQSAFNLEV